MVREFFKESGLDEEMLEGICFLVGHHHTFTDIDGQDYQILLEADSFVKAGEDEKYRKAANRFHEKVFKTRTGLRLLEDIYMKG